MLFEGAKVLVNFNVLKNVFYFCLYTIEFVIIIIIIIKFIEIIIMKFRGQNLKRKNLKFNC